MPSRDSSLPWASTIWSASSARLLLQAVVVSHPAQCLDTRGRHLRPLGQLPRQFQRLGQGLARLRQAVDAAMRMHALAADALTRQAELGQQLTGHELGQKRRRATVGVRPTFT